MTQVEDQASQAEERSQETRSFVRQVRAATRRKYTPEEKIRIVLEGFRREATVNHLCRREGIKPHSYYAWTKGFMEAGKERLTRDSVRDATRQEIEQLKREIRWHRSLRGPHGNCNLEDNGFRQGVPLRQAQGKLCTHIWLLLYWSDHTLRSVTCGVWAEPSLRDTLRLPAKGFHPSAIPFLHSPGVLIA